jgi:phosphatidylserine/phosphatidylglycerophosphate/cardiolipin synthase-like enzyme
LVILTMLVPFGAAGLIGVVKDHVHIPGFGAPATAGASGPAALSVITEPTTGMGRIDQLISTAHEGVEIEMYEVSDQTVETELAADAARGVRVQVLLDSAYSGRSENGSAFSFLSSHGVDVRWASPGEIFHEKSVCVDLVCAFGTANLTSQYYATSRDFWILDTIPADVQAIDSTFASDWTGSTPAPAPGGQDLVWSPGSATAILGVISGAQHTLYVENEEMADTAIVTALVAAAHRGVAVSVIMTTSPTWADAFSRLRAGGVRVVTYPSTASLYIHAKVVVADGTTAFVGSENFSYASLDHNRELGIVTTDGSVVGPVAAAVGRDASG